MSTRSNSSHLFSPLRDSKILIRRRNLGEPSSLFEFEEVMNNNQNQEPPPQNGPPPMVRPNGQAPRMMEKLFQNTCQFHGLPGDDANRHIDKFLEITQHMKQNGVSDDALRLSLFPYSLTHQDIACVSGYLHLVSEPRDAFCPRLRFVLDCVLYWTAFCQELRFAYLKTICCILLRTNSAKLKTALRFVSGSRDRPPMLAPGRYPQWRSRFLRYVDTIPNGEALRKCIMSGPFEPTTVLVQSVEATDNSLAVLEHTIVETPTNMSPENKAHFLAEKEATHLILT
nr:reverse transcriptase domain-containing protein [Tanacetum cinerariifolium]